MYKTPVRLRSAAFDAQQGRCYYCQFEMWQIDPAPFMAKHGLSRKAAMRFQCTAEHLVARREGGRDQAGNIVAACAYCNRLRHKRKKPPTPPAFVQFVQSRLHKHRWNSHLLGPR